MFEHARDVAKLLPSDLAKLIGVNRCTVSFWYNDRAKPHIQLMDRVTSMLDLVRQATDAGDLPVPHDVPRRMRPDYLRNVVLRRGVHD